MGSDSNFLKSWFLYSSCSLTSFFFYENHSGYKWSEVTVWNFSSHNIIIEQF